MFLIRVILMALRGLRANLLRSLLATLGVIIGVGAVIAAMSVLEGAQHDVLEKFESLGSTHLYVLPGAATSGGRHVGTVQTLKLHDVDVLLREAESVQSAAPESMRLAQLKFFSKNKEVRILGTNQNYGPMNNYKAVDGQFISLEDVRAERRVVVLGHQVARDLFGEASAVGQPLRIGIPGGKRSSFRVIGVMEKKGNLGFRSVDEQVIVPITTAMKRLFGVNFIDSITVEAQDPKHVEFCRSEIKKILRTRHKISIGQKDDFRVFSSEEQLETFQDVARIFAVVFYSIAGISLVVGGIGIMNIMLVSVTERTREIGVRLAVGAQRADILWQFLIEAGAISVFGGIFGVLTGMLMANLIENIYIDLLETYTPPRVIVWALMMAMITGIVSGIYPAYKASRLDPVDALRYE